MIADDRRGRFIARVRRMYGELAASEERRRAFFEGEGRALLGAAMIHSGALPRGAIRRIARRANARRHLHVAELDEGRVDDLVLDGEERLASSVADGGGAILAALHFGAFRRLAPFFVRRGHRVALLATRAATPHLVRDVPDAFVRHERDAALAKGFVDRYSPIDSTSPTAMWRMRVALSEGQLVVFYPDGNTGIDEKRADASCHAVSFFGRSLRAHAGIGWLASASDRPVIPVIARESMDRATMVELGEPIRRAAHEPRAAYRARIVETIYALLEDEVRRAPERWEQWAFVWQWAERGARPPPPQTAPAIDLAPLRDRRLRLVDPHVWMAELEGAVHVLDVKTWTSFGTAPALVALVDAAEHGVTLGAWLDAISVADPAATSSPTTAGMIFATMRALGAVEVDGPLE